MNTRKIKKTLRNNMAAIVMVLLAMASILIIRAADMRLSRDLSKDYALKDTEAEKDERMYVPVPYAKFEDLVESYKTANMVNMQGMGDLKYDEKEHLTTIDVSGMSKSGLSLLKGTSLGTVPWCDDNTCSFETKQIDTVVVVRCPAGLLARLVGNAEKQ